MKGGIYIYIAKGSLFRYKTMFPPFKFVTCHAHIHKHPFVSCTTRKDEIGSPLWYYVKGVEVLSSRM